MDTRDNELDSLFQSALNDQEIEPSAAVWAGITARLDADKRKRSLVPFLSIAAGLLLLVTIGLLFIPETVKVNKRQPSEKITKNVLPVKQEPVIKADALPVASQNKKALKTVIAAVANLEHAKKTKINEALISEKAAPEQKTNSAKPGNEPELAQASRDNELENPVMPGLDNAIISVDDNIQVKPQIVAIQAPTGHKWVTVTHKKRRIRSLGDVFNVMIAAVDKREDKIIEFSNTDEDDATITGVNLGIIKVKKEK